MTPRSSRRDALAKGLGFCGWLFVATVVSALLHELGHCLFYWGQGIPAGLSLVKEYPLRDITDHEYAVGSAGGPLASIVQLGVGLVWVAKARAGSRWRRAGVAFTLANVLYLVVRSLLAVLSGEGGELTDAASLVGASYQATVAFFLALAAVAGAAAARLAGARPTWGWMWRGSALLVLYIVFIVVLETVDRSLFWERFPTVEIGEGRLYNEHRR